METLARKPAKTSIREQLESLEASKARIYGNVKRQRYEDSSGTALQKIDEPLLKRPCVRIEEDNAASVAAEEESGENLDSDAGLLVQSEKEGPYEPLVLSDEESPERVEVPAPINSRLLEHQREGVRFLYNLYKQKIGGILGDDMGLGKTIQSIAFIAAILHNDGELFRLPFRSKANLSEAKKKVVLVLCPTSVIENWQREFEAWGSFPLGVYHGAQREAIVDKVRRDELDVVITSHDTFRIHGSSLQEIDWDCVIVDEAHRLKNEKSQLYKACCRLRTKCRFGLTGTILQNKLIDLFNVFEWAAPGCLGTREHFRGYYDEPIKQGQKISASQVLVELAEKRRQHLLAVLRRYSLRRTKDETIGHLLKGKEDIVIFCAMSPIQRRVYKRLLESPDFQCLVRKNEPCGCGSEEPSSKCCLRTAPKGPIWSYLHKGNPDGCESCPCCLVLPCLNKLQQVSNHLELLKPNLSDDIEKRRKDAAFASLVFGDDAPSLGGIQPDESFLGLSDSQNCGKMLALKNLLSKWTSQGDKVLLFSYSVRMLGILEKFLIRRGYCFCRLDGSTPMNARQGIVDEFNTSPSKQVFLISTRAGGLGLNLVSANRVVVFDPNWNPAQDLQAQDRSFRFGQKRHVTVFRLLAAGSLEELIYTRQIYKQQLFNLAVTGNREKRYFEGVQDSKGDKGELFGLSNLFRDLQDKVFTSDIIEQHEERLMKIQVESYDSDSDEPCRPRRGRPRALEDGDEEEDDEHGVSGLARLVKENMQDSQKTDEEETVGLQDMLTKSGVVYAHKNEEVVNARLLRGQKIEELVDVIDSGDEERETITRRTRVTRVIEEKTVRKSASTTRREPKQTQGEAEGSNAPKETKPKQRHRSDQTAKELDRSKEPTAAKQKPATKKSELFSELAKFKGLGVKEFSQWMVSASQKEREELLANFRERK
ncbi:switch 2 [Selaginella moellendorffii]|uniref:switch 2 n=1 Tax=Selaginella moellendorffii TaxID=88036 RepID=UPI000D1C2B2F|nr:switch 2 [Selaginella moellendorffii]|eukprot:XP_024522854.1 switch 2 [Selaginella moellendorffii]